MGGAVENKRGTNAQDAEPSAQEKRCEPRNQKGTRTSAPGAPGDLPSEHSKQRRREGRSRAWLAESRQIGVKAKLAREATAQELGRLPTRKRPARRRFEAPDDSGGRQCRRRLLRAKIAMSCRRGFWRRVQRGEFGVDGTERYREARWGDRSEGRDRGRNRLWAEEE